MTAETLYTPKGAGHGAPDGGKREYVAKDELYRCFREWLDRDNIIPRMIPDLTGMTYEDVNALLVPFEGDKRLVTAGVFLTAAYNRLDQDVVFFDSDAAPNGVDFLGYRLAKGKTLVLVRGAGCNMGKEADGNIINFCNTENSCEGDKMKGIFVNYGNIDFLGQASDGTIINFGKVLQMGDETFGLAINYGEVESMGPCSSGTIINMGDCFDIGMGMKNGIVISGKTARQEPLSNPELFGPQHRARLYIREGELLKMADLHTYLKGLGEKLGRDRPLGDIIEHLKGLDPKADINRLLIESGRLEG